MYRKSQYPYFSLRINATLAAKLDYLASIHGRSSNKEIEQIILSYITSWNEQHLFYDVTLDPNLYGSVTIRKALRIPTDTMELLKNIASYNGRSTNKEIEQLVAHYIYNWETLNGLISISNTNNS